MTQVGHFEGHFVVVWAAWPIDQVEANHVTRCHALNLNPPFKGVRVFPASSLQDAETLKEVLQ